MSRPPSSASYSGYSPVCTCSWTVRLHVVLGPNSYPNFLLHLAFVISDLPSLLAVDDLEDISLLEQYVGESAVMLILLSQGYLLSRNVDDSMSNPSDAAISTACVTHTVFPCARSASVR